MTGQMPGHARFDELAAGYAVHALEPADEQRFLCHVEQCLRCQQSVAGFQEVAAALAGAASPAQPSAGLGETILAAALADPDQQAYPGFRRAGAEPADPAPGDAELSRVVPLRRRPGRRWQRPAAAAAAVALIAAGGVWAGLGVAAGGSQPVLAACARPHTCVQVGLTATASGRTAATVIVHDGVAWMQPSAMAANPAGEIYVLWQITGARIPLAVGSFDIRAGAHPPIRIGSLAVPYSGTWAFAVSLEHGRTIPVRPSKPVALGQVS
jgi:anti-sigma factor ChrR (cupin superfamily)